MERMGRVQDSESDDDQDVESDESDRPQDDDQICTLPGQLYIWKQAFKKTQKSVGSCPVNMIMLESAKKIRNKSAELFEEI